MVNRAALDSARQRVSVSHRLEIYVPVRLGIFVSRSIRLGMHLLPPWNFSADMFDREQ